MSRLRRGAPATERGGVILLVTISLLVLFALVGIAFVVYAEAQANTSRIWREGEAIDQPDMDPELLLAYFLGQLIYDTDNPLSALRGHSLARDMYGRSGSTVPFNGTGRLHTPGQDDYYNVDYTNYSGGVPRDPNQVGSGNPPYTYPDFNHMYLAAVRAGESQPGKKDGGQVLIPSYYRIGPNGPITLRPNTNYHTQFPPLADPSGDVKNRADGPGYSNGPNDSIWIDAGFPVMTAPDGRKFKPLFAPLIEDLDNRLNINVVGNIIGEALNGENTSTYAISHQGMVRGEVSFDRLLTWPGGPTAWNPEARAIFRGANGIAGRYDPNLWQGWAYNLAPQYTASSHFYSPTNQDCWPDSTWYEIFFLPHLKPVPGLSGDGRDQMDAVPIDPNNANTRWRLGWCPRVEHAFSNGWITTYDKMLNPTMYNFFDPTINTMYISGVLRNIKDRRFDPFNMEALLRYGDSGSPSMSTDLFKLCPNAFGNPTTGPRNRRLVTTLSMDMCAPGVMPCYTNPNGQSTLVAAGNSYPSTPPIPFPASGASPGTGEFDASWQATSAALGRLNLNQSYSNEFPTLSAASASCFNFTDPNVVLKYQKAYSERVNICQEVYKRLQAATGATDPTAQRWLAQLAVNIVDFCQYMPTNKSGDPNNGFVPDDIMTCFQYAPGKWVYGTVLPRLVVNEAYVEVAKTNQQNQNAPRPVNFWVELHNSYESSGGRGSSPEQVSRQHPAIPHSENAKARLWVNYPNNQGYAAYRLLLADAAGNSTAIADPNNPEGTPQGIQKTIKTYTPAPTPNQPLVLSGDELNMVRQINSPDLNYDPSAVDPQAPKEVPFNNCSWGRNCGWYVIGPPTPFPGTDPTPMVNPTNYKKFFATLPHQDMTVDNGMPGQQYTIVLQRLACPYLPPQEDPNALAQKGYFNPYVTVDYMDQVAANDGDQPLAQRQSVGRNQPYAGSKANQVPQTPANAVGGQPQHSFFARNAQKAGDPNPQFAFDYVFWGNRMLLNTLELLHVCGYKPSEFSQRFMGPPDPATGKPGLAGRFGHRAPWFESDKLIYRGLEFFEGYMRNQWTPPGGRDAGRVNLNTVWDFETFQGLCDRHGAHYFTDPPAGSANAPGGVRQVFQRMLQSRTLGANPSANDRPFLSYAAPYTPPGPQVPQGLSLQDTILREAPDLDPQEQALPPQQRRRLFEPKYLTPQNPNPPELRAFACREGGQDPTEPPHPYLWEEILRRLCDHTTTRSNVFVVWLTVGFFEVLDDSNPNLPPQLGKEIGAAEGRQKRYRMFTVIDRTRLTVALDPTDPAGQKLIPGQAGPRPFFIDSLTSVSGSGLPEPVKVAVLNGKYEELTWRIQVGDQLVVDTEGNREPITVVPPPNPPPVAADQYGDYFYAVFRKPHAVGFCISNGLPGNPGPQPRFDMRHPSYQSIVRWFSIVEGR